MQLSKSSLLYHVVQRQSLETCFFQVFESMLSFCRGLFRDVSVVFGTTSVSTRPSKKLTTVFYDWDYVCSVMLSGFFH